VPSVTRYIAEVAAPGCKPLHPHGKPSPGMQSPSPAWKAPPADKARRPATSCHSGSP